MRGICLWCLLNCAVTKKGIYNQLRWPSGESVRLGSCRLGFGSESGQTNDFKIGIYSFLA